MKTSDFLPEAGCRSREVTLCHQHFYRAQVTARKHQFSGLSADILLKYLKYLSNVTYIVSCALAILPLKLMVLGKLNTSCLKSSK